MSAPVGRYAPEPPRCSPPEWASMVEDRRPEFKIHKSRPQAYNAIMLEVRNHPRGGVIYRWDGTHWVEDFRYEQDMTCVNCGGPIDPSRSGRKYDYSVPREQTRLIHWNCKDGI